jgi:hypothetical protein
MGLVDNDNTFDTCVIKVFLSSGFMSRSATLSLQSILSGLIVPIAVCSRTQNDMKVQHVSS